MANPAGAAPVPQDERFVRRAYFDLLNTADPSQESIDEGVDDLAGSRTGAWLAELQRTEEGRGAAVDNAYEDVLFRNSDASGRDFFVQRLGQGFSRQRVSANVLRVRRVVRRPGWRHRRDVARRPVPRRLRARRR
jgi:hypothetical protein